MKSFGKSHRPALAFLLTAVALIAPLPGAFADEQSLKMDVPKFDTSVPESDRKLKGGIQHHEEGRPNRLQGDLSKGAIQGRTKKKHEGPKFLFGFGKSDTQKPLKSNLRNDALTAQVDSGIGIIGVKFILGMGRPPIINRVFPGTPAYEQGLRINDVIVAVDGIPTAGLTKDEVYAMIVGTPNTPVTVSVARNGDFIARTMNRMDFNDITDLSVRRDYLLSM